MKNVPLNEVRKINNLKEMLTSSVALYSDKPAFLSKPEGKDNYHSISFNQLGADVNALGTALIDLGLQGRRIVIIGENRYEWSVSYLACVNGTGIVVPLDRELPQHEIAGLIMRSQATAVIFSSTVAEKISAIAPALKTVEHFISMDSDTISGSFKSFSRLLQKGHLLVQNGDTRFINAPIDNEALSILLFTSGTTDSSKAVMLSHRNICSNLMAQCSMLEIKPSDIFLSVLPIHHTYECTCGFLCPLYRGATVAYCEGLRYIPKNLKESRATVMLGVPLIYELIYRNIWSQARKKGSSGKLRAAVWISNLLRSFGIDITKKLFSAIHDTFGGNLRLFISGAAGIDPRIAKGIRDFGILFVQGYGLTEGSPIVTLNRNVDFRDDSAGLVLPNLELKIDAPDTAGIGEICVKGPSVMLGYYENEEATAKVLQNGWFHTGDAGYVGKSGFLYITGRKKNVIVTKNGKNIYPEEIECLLDKSPYIKESMVYDEKNDNSGDIVVAAMIVVDNDKISEEFKETEAGADEIYELIKREIKAVNKKLVRYKYIKHFKIKETEFAKTSTRKIKRYLESRNS
ncbi:MAG: AMP-dependent synthetase/ligase [Smithellaceae bacterium]